MTRKHVYPKHGNLSLPAIANPPKTFYRQETDWTCSIACIRTMMSGFLTQVPGEEELVQQFQLTPGPHYSKQIKERQILAAYDAIYGCDLEKPDFAQVIQLMAEGYYVMLESMYNYAHWYVLLGYYPLEDQDIEKSKLLIYDPYYNEVRLLNADEFLSMWIDGDYEHTRVKHDFIALRGK